MKRRKRKLVRTRRRSKKAYVNGRVTYSCESWICPPLASLCGAWENWKTGEENLKSKKPSQPKTTPQPQQLASKLKESDRRRC
ncbi:MAG: hypothetical protein ACKERG_04535 [Candidatus Hodgkinia cicadicola]